MRSHPFAVLAVMVFVSAAALPVASAAGQESVAVPEVRLLRAIRSADMPDPEVVQAGTSRKRIGSYVIAAPQEQAVLLTTITVRTGRYANANLEGLRVQMNGEEIEGFYAELESGAVYVFNARLRAIPRGGKARIDVYADVIPAGRHIFYATQLEGCEGMLATQKPAACPSKPVRGQRLGVVAIR